MLSPYRSDKPGIEIGRRWNDHKGPWYLEMGHQYPYDNKNVKVRICTGWKYPDGPPKRKVDRAMEKAERLWKRKADERSRKADAARHAREIASEHEKRLKG